MIHQNVLYFPTVVNNFDTSQVHHAIWQYDFEDSNAVPEAKYEKTEFMPTDHATGEQLYAI